MVRRLIWSIEARTSRKNIFDYWNNRNKSKVYSNKLNQLFKENLLIVTKLPDFGNPTKNDDIKFIIVSHFEIIYKITDSEIVVLDIWDTRQKPDNFPIK
ncbi:type II toxin-antitoxin system RelE/ParE family toxin [Flavobacterium azooxidireducens]|uniref:Type II toxin-antitoxin system RelE/ParE family toxin n=1 Tax=Flavobacterium azooxidireducens TaxID=1871076 RepID=A0ABY4KC91_9FLAO|nr:type II toxin-antitoxin system RelE/ParE family toxin [Flavobacterium azooxidireducens]UPQ78410.1 type II toxin-antitoxin system RelE/ParE family toxin [Flavobacterium azooxidireducens]